MGIYGAKKKVEAQLKGKDPKSIAWWFLDRALILMKEAQVDKKLIHDRVDELMKP